MKPTGSARNGNRGRRRGRPWLAAAGVALALCTLAAAPAREPALAMAAHSRRPGARTGFAALLQQFNQGVSSPYDTDTPYVGDADGPPIWVNGWDQAQDYVTLDLPVARPGFGAAWQHPYVMPSAVMAQAIVAGQPCQPRPVIVDHFLNDENVLRYRLLRLAQAGDAPPAPQAAMIAFDTGQQWVQSAQQAASPAQARRDGKNAVKAFERAIAAAPWEGLYYYDAGVAAKPVWDKIKPNAILFFRWYLLTADPRSPQAQAARAAIAAIQVEAQTQDCESFDFSNVWNPLAWAVAAGDLAGARRRIALGGDVNQPWAGLTLLGIAAVNGDMPMARLLLAHGTDPGKGAVSTDPMGADRDDCSSALCTAAEFGRVGMLRALLAHGASPGPNSVAYAAATGHLAAAELVAGKLAPGQLARDSVTWKSPLAYAIAGGRLAALRWMLERFYLHSPLRDTALMWAALYGRADMARLLLAHGANPNAVTCNDGRWVPGTSTPKYCFWWAEPLTVASEGNASVAVVRTLLAHGAKVNQVTPNLYAPLGVAAANGQIQIAAALLAAGAEVNQTDSEGDTALIDAVQVGKRMIGENLGVIRLLVRHGALVNVRDAQGKTALSYASTPDVTAYLRAHGAQ